MSTQDRKRLRDASILDFIDAPKTKKRLLDNQIMNTVLQNLSDNELLSNVNNHLKSRRLRLFVCYDCNSVVEFPKFSDRYCLEGSYLEVDADGTMRPICPDCTLWCGGQPYSSFVKHLHHDETCPCGKYGDGTTSTSTTDSSQE